MTRPKAINHKKLVAFVLLICKNKLAWQFIKSSVVIVAYLTRQCKFTWHSGWSLPFFFRSLWWRVLKKRMNCKNRMPPVRKSSFGRSTEGATLCALVQGMQYPCAGQGRQPCPVSGVSPLSTGYYLRINEAGLQQSCFDFFDQTNKKF